MLRAFLIQQILNAVALPEFPVPRMRDTASAEFYPVPKVFAFTRRYDGIQPRAQCHLTINQPPPLLIADE
jgi:hypothetical protein